MSIDYAIAAIPTLYNGRRYRSRLEAKWAAFFDRLEWQPEYEPYDLGGWSPDFLVIRQSVTTPILIEVKPIREPDHETQEKMASACCERQWNGHALLVGTSPCLVERNDLPFVHIGWMSYYHKQFMTNEYKRYRFRYPAAINWIPDLERPTAPSASIFLYDDREEGRSALPYNGWLLYHEYTMGLWDAACNAVQWHGRDA